MKQNDIVRFLISAKSSLPRGAISKLRGLAPLVGTYSIGLSIPLAGRWRIRRCCHVHDLKQKKLPEGAISISAASSSFEKVFGIEETACKGFNFPSAASKRSSNRGPHLVHHIAKFAVRMHRKMPGTRARICFRNLRLVDGQRSPRTVKRIDQRLVQAKIIYDGETIIGRHVD